MKFLQQSLYWCSFAFAAMFVNLAWAQPAGTGWGDNSVGQASLLSTSSNLVQISANGYCSFGLFSDGTCIAAGSFLIQPAYVPPGLSNLTQVAAGFAHALALQTNGQMFAWGDNSFGQTNIPFQLLDPAKIAAGGFHSLVLNKDGTVRCWGDNSRGQTRVPAGLFGIIDVAAGFYHSLAITKDRHVVAWGDNVFGQSRVPADLANVVAVAAGVSHSLALRGNGTVVGWGDSPAVPSGLSNVVAIAAGDSFSLALTSNGSVVAWGNNGFGQTAVPTALGNVVAISAGAEHALALFGAAPWPMILQQPTSVQTNQHASITLQVLAEAAGPLSYSWWLNGSPLPDATNAAFSIDDLTVTNVGNYCVFVSAGGFTVQSKTASVITDVPVIVQISPNQIVFGGSNALLSATVFGAAPIQYRWYFQDTGLSDATNSALLLTNVQPSNSGPYTLVANNLSGSVTSAPIQIRVVFRPGISVHPSNQTAQLYQNVVFNVQATGTAPLTYQWRLNGAKISGGIGPSITLQRVDVDRAGAYDVIVSNLYGAITSQVATLQVDVPEGSVRAWGGNFSGETIVPPGLSNVIAVSAADTLSAALRADGTVTVWGRSGTAAFQPPPGLSNVTAISASSSEILALRGDGTVVAWGTGSLGNTNVPAGLSNVVSIAAGASFSLAVRGDGSLVYWGAQLSPVPPANVSNFTAVAAANFDGIALKGDNRVISIGPAWPPPGNLSNVVAISASGLHYVALVDDGTVVAWPDLSDVAYLRVPGGLTNVVSISAGNAHTLALKPDGTVAAWGDGRNGVTNIPPQVQSNTVAIAAGVSHNLVITGSPVWPQITSHPQSVTTNAHASVRFSVDATSRAAISYQWQHDGFNIPGATNSFLDLTNIEASDVGQYRVLLAANHQAVWSKPASLVLFTPVFEGMPATLEMIESGTISFTPTVIGAPPLTFQWFHDDAAVPGATNASLVIRNTQLSDAGSYLLLAQNSYTTVLSPTAMLTVWQRPRIITDAGEMLNASKQVILPEGSDFTITVQATGSPPLSFNWVAPSGLTLTTNATLTLTNLTFARSGQYFLQVSNPYLSLGPVPPTQFNLFLNVLPPRGRVIAWGVSTELTAPVPANLSNVVALAAGYKHNLVLKSDGTVTGWGLNTVGQSNVAAGKTNVVGISAAGNYSLAVLSDGTVIGTGQNAFGFPVVNNVAQVSAGTNHVLALRRDSTVIGWGRNNSGQLNIPSGLSNVVAVAAGGLHSLALKQDGTVVGWGGNLFGQAQPPSGLSNVVAIATGYQHSLALFSSGLVRAWGDSSQGQLSGLVGRDDSTLPSLGVSNIVAIAAGLDFSMALRNDGKIIAWGASSHFYDGTLSIPYGLLNAVMIAAGPSHGIALSGIPLADRPRLSLSTTQDGFSLSWPTTFTSYDLEAAPELDGPFTNLNVSFETNSVSQTITTTLPTPAQNLFLRLRAR